MTPTAQDKLRVALVEITGFHWTRRAREEWTHDGGQLTRKRDPRAGRPSSYHFLPASVGLLQAYTQAYAPDPSRYEFLLPLYRRLPVADAVEHVLGADVLALSLYCWNVRLSLEVARRVKRLRPETLIVAGGPQVPDRAEEFLRENPFLDVVCHGEGEVVFLQVLERARSRDFSGVPAISFTHPDGVVETRKRAPRVTDLTQIPSPYLAGVFEPLIAANPNENWQVVWETNRGCPFSCTFCDWGSAIASKVYQFPLQRLLAEVNWMADKKIGFIFVADANYGILPRDLEIAQYVADKKAATGYPMSLGVQSAKNATERVYKVQKLLHSMSTTGVTIAMQSNDPTTLEYIKRDNISAESFRELQRRYTRDGIETYTDLIIGMPGESYDSFTNGVERLIDDGQHNRIQFYNCYILPNAEMGDPAYQQKFGMRTVDSRMSDPHDSLLRPEADVDEYLKLVIETDAMPREDWVRAKTFAWMADLVYFGRLLQIPMVLLHERYGLGYRELIEAATTADPARFPVVAEVARFFADHARAIQQGGEEFVASERWLRVRWPAHQLALIQLASEWKLEGFYREMEQRFLELLRAKDEAADAQPLQEAIRLNESLLRHPFEVDDLELELEHNLWEFYEAVLAGARIPLERRLSRYSIERTKPMWFSFEDWCEDIIARFNRKGAFLYPIKPADSETFAGVRRNASLTIGTYMVGPQPG